MTAEHTRAVELARAQATAYVWGRQDAGESDRDTGFSLDFGSWYAEQKRAYLQEEAGSLPNLQAAYEQWQQIRQTGPEQTGQEQQS